VKVVAATTFTLMRIIAGKYRSRILKSLKGGALRPTSDRLRETLFNILGADVAGSRFLDVFAGTGAVGIEALSRGAAEAIFIEKHAFAAKLIRSNLESLGIARGCTVLTGEALTALEKLAMRSSQVLGSGNTWEGGDVREGRDATGGSDVKSSVQVRESGFPAPSGKTRNAANILTDQGQLIDFVFVDPPYAAHEDYMRALQFLGSDAATFLAPGALVIFEHHHKFALPETSGRLTRTRLLKQGDAALSFYRPTRGHG